MLYSCRRVHTNVDDSQPKKDAARSKPKSAAAAPKASAAAAAAAAKGNAANGGKAQRKRGRTGRPKPKTADELDAEMSEYFAPNAGGEASGNTDGAAAAAPAVNNGGDAAMVDEVL